MVAVLAALGAPRQALPQGPDHVSVSVGAFDVFDARRAGEFRIEYRSTLDWRSLRPFTGVMVNTDRGAYGYGGIQLDIDLGGRFVVTPSLAVGGYARGNSRDLGHAVEFSSQIELAYRFEDLSRLGVGIGHISNSSIGDWNPGVESVMVTYALPFDTHSGR